MVNRNNQQLISKSTVRGNHPYARKWDLQCLNCNATYKANSCDFHNRRCPHCDGGKPGS